MPLKFSGSFLKAITELTRVVRTMQIGSVATAAGIGGGAFFVPLFNILLRFSKLHLRRASFAGVISTVSYSLGYGRRLQECC